MTQHMPYRGSDIHRWLQVHHGKAAADPHGYGARMTIADLLGDYLVRADSGLTLTERLILDGDDD